MSNEKTYTCVCGRVFNNPQAFNGHKSHCIKHNIEKYGSTEYLKSVETRRHSDAQAKTIVSTYKRKKEEKLQAWISEKHTCETCGKILTSYWGSGRFCSVICSRRRKHCEETKKRISNSIVRRNIKLQICKNCGQQFWTSSSYRKFCNSNCKDDYNNYCKLKALYRKSVKTLYYEQCRFQFSIGDFNLLTQGKDTLLLKGAYSAPNRGNNIDGFTRDHRISKDYGYRNRIDPYIISHPCNCEVMTQEENFNKRSSNSTTLEELYQAIISFDKVYGEYPNKINYVGLDMFVGSSLIESAIQFS